MRLKPLLIALLLLACASTALVKAAPLTPAATDEPPQGPSGQQTYRQYCASCHGANAKGAGPAASALKTPPPDLTTLAKRHDGKFPYEYVAGVVRFGKPLSAHGSPDMPVWGPIFSLTDFHEVVVRQRIKNLCEFLASLQEK
ncbi:MAG TPA: cytochrome c [Candidatus Methylomirabilis sp.]|nr:cytochrome c [Candidatus Methylomirabilis sp.]